MPLGMFTGGGPGFGTVGPKSDVVFVSADGMADEAGVAEGPSPWTEAMAGWLLVLAEECLTDEIFQTAMPAATRKRMRMIGRLLFTASPFVNDFAADNRSDGSSGKIPAVKGRVPGLRQ